MYIECVVECVALTCSDLQCVVECVAVTCSDLQCAAECVAECVAVCCIKLPRDAVRCSVLQYDTMC